MTHSPVSSAIHHIVSSAFQSVSATAGLNKALGVERFEEILSDTHPRNAEEAGRSYGEEDFEYHRQSSHHIHHPLSTHLPPDVRRKKGVLKKGKKQRRRASVPGETPTIEEAEEDEDEAGDTDTERSAEELRQPGAAEAVQFFLQDDEVTERRADLDYMKRSPLRGRAGGAPAPGAQERQGAGGARQQGPQGAQHAAAQAGPAAPRGVRGAERAGGGQEPGAAVEGDGALDQV
ncbi:solute carrier family 4 (anion exchanger), member 2 [Columba livia]|uniref:Solute carrier family 4 (Anion exchanger), member 2 n=1 Tax=Columba livia TaxID=8932 RepID=A0A2I0LI45_COLLI|nr:solute carrier family 4 (anion exchanger), member 2 [Columba livia]